MNIRTKVSVLVILFWLVMVISVYLGSQFIIKKSFLKLEEESVVDNLARIEETIHQMEDAVSATLGSWATWDDSYQYVADRNKEYINSNYGFAALLSADFNLALIFDTTGKLIYSSAMDLEKTKFVPLPEGLMKYLQPQGKLVAQTTIGKHTNGLIALPSGTLVMMTAHPIVTSENTGPIRGTLIAGKYFDAETLKELRNITKVHASIYPLTQLKDKRDILTELEKSPYFIIRTNDKKLMAYRLLTDINGANIALIEADLPRSIYQIGIKTIQYYNYAGAVLIFLIIAALWTSVNSIIIRRVEKLKKLIGPNIKSQSAISKDEISALKSAFDEKGKQLNDYLVELAEAQKKLAAETRELEKTHQHLAITQQIARLDYCFYNRKLDQITWAKRINDTTNNQALQSLHDVTQTIHPDDREVFNSMINAVFTTGRDQECEIRVQDAPGHYRWYYTIGHPYSKTQPIEQMVAIIMDISRHKDAEEELKALQEKLLTTAKQAGMSEVATSILHNVGNVLNSAKVSIQLLKESMDKPNFKNLVVAKSLLQEHLNDLPTYFKTDPKGKILPEYLIEVISALENENIEANHAINLLAKSIKSIEDIVAMQQRLF